MFESIDRWCRMLPADLASQLDGYENVKSMEIKNRKTKTYYDVSILFLIHPFWKRTMMMKQKHFPKIYS
jgi:hypothetical protein